MQHLFLSAKRKWNSAFSEEKSFVTTCQLYPPDIYTPEFHAQIFENTVSKKGVAPTPFLKIYKDIYNKHFDTRSTIKKALFTATADELNKHSAVYFNNAFKNEAALRGMTKAPQIKIAQVESIFEEEGRIVHEHRPGLMVNDPALV